eukprot:EG_transcript_42796
MFRDEVKCFGCPMLSERFGSAHWDRFNPAELLESVIHARDGTIHKIQAALQQPPQSTAIEIDGDNEPVAPTSPMDEEEATLTLEKVGYWLEEQLGGAFDLTQEEENLSKLKVEMSELVRKIGESSIAESDVEIFGRYLRQALFGHIKN